MCSDVFFKEVLKETYELKQTALLKKSKIEVNEGATLFGVADYTGTLLPN